MGNLSKKQRDFLDTAIKRLKVAVDADSHNRVAAEEDLKFLHGDQWDSKEKDRRKKKGRPVLQINLLPKFTDQVVGDMLHNSPTIKITASDAASDPQIAIIRQGLIKDIEYRSNAKSAYTYGARQMVSCAYGAWRVLTRYCDDNPFNQEIYIEGIRNPLMVYMDPLSKDQSYSDAKYGFLLEKLPKDVFEEKYPNVKYPTSLESTQGAGEELWYDGDNVTVAEYYVSTTEKVTMLQLEDGKVVTQEQFDKLQSEWQEATDKLIEGTVAGSPVSSQPQPQPVVAKTRVTDKIVVKQWVITGSDIISGGEEGNKVAGKFIPLVLLKGKELNIAGKNHTYSLIRHAKDPQKMVNYWNTAAAETIALAPKTPWLGTPKQFEGFENDYAAANVENFPVLMYNPDPEAQGPPQRTSGANPPTAIFEQIRRGEDNIKSVIGMFNADVGAPGSEQTGAAIIARQKPGDVSTFEFSENLSRAILYTGRIINEMIPEIYDTERDVRVRNIDESDGFVPINTTIGNAMKSMQSNPDMYAGMDPDKLVNKASMYGEDAKFNDISNGKYDVVVTLGPSYATQRQESSQHLLQLVQAMPEQMAVASDLIAENMDFKGADELARRLRMPLVAQGIIQPRKGDPQPPPKQEGPSPEEQIQMALIEVEKSKVALNELKTQNEQLKMQMDMQLAEIKTQAELAKTAASLRSTEQNDSRSAQLDEMKLRREIMLIMKDLRSDKESTNAD